MAGARPGTAPCQVHPHALRDTMLQSIIRAFPGGNRLREEKGWDWTKLCPTQSSSHWLHLPPGNHLQSTDPPRSAGGSQGTSRGQRAGPGPPEHRPPVISNVPSDPLSEGLPLRSQRQLDPSRGGRWPGTGPEKIARRREGGLGGGRHSAWELAHHLHIPDGETEDRHRGGTAQSH